MYMKTRFSITLDKELVKNIDKKRKDIPRSTYINKLLLKLNSKGGKKWKK